MDWVLVALAVMLAAIVSPLAYFMIRPIQFDRVARIGVFALWFPLHLLAITAIAGAMMIVSWALDATVAAGLFAVLVLVTALMAVVPCVATWRGARSFHVP